MFETSLQDKWPDLLVYVFTGWLVYQHKPRIFMLVILDILSARSILSTSAAVASVAVCSNTPARASRRNVHWHTGIAGEWGRRGLPHERRRAGQCNRYWGWWIRVQRCSCGSKGNRVRRLPVFFLNKEKTGSSTVSSAFPLLTETSQSSTGRSRVKRVKLTVALKPSVVTPPSPRKLIARDSPCQT